MSYDDIDQGNIGSGNGLLGDWWHQAITWTNVHFLLVRFYGIYLRAISQEIPQSSISKISLKIIYPEFHSNLPEAK